MSELKVHKAYNRWIDEDMPTPNDDLICNEFYLKYEADKVIAELQKQVHDYAQGLYVIQARAEKELRHTNYKRCLAMAEMCDEVMMSCELLGYTVLRIWANKHEWAMRWKYRWLELAEKFKDKEM